MNANQDIEFMAKAINLAKKGQFTTTPNPNVGCVIVKDNVIIGEGWHKKAGTGHAEVNALKDLSVKQTSGATAYVTLEPCSHYGRTPPCAERLIEAKVQRVVVGMLDTNPQVSGNGIRMLEAAGIDVDMSPLNADCRGLNPGFFSRMEKGRPFVKVKLAASLDGKTALQNGQSQWITGPAARADVQTYRAQSCAIITTATTVLADDASLNVRGEQLNFEYPVDATNTEIRQPTVVVLDGKGKLTEQHRSSLKLFSTGAKVIVIHSNSLSEHDLSGKDSDSLMVAKANYEEGSGFDLGEVLELCAKQQFNNVWVEAGGKLAASFVNQELVDELIVYIAPKIMGANAQDVLPVGPFESMSDVQQLQLIDNRQVGDDIKLTYRC